MANNIKITIPEPCHENWQAMTPVEKGRFCALCKKNVIDFTFLTDREIIQAYNTDTKLCGRFTTSQLNRDLVEPKDKSSIWLATTSAIISFLGIGTHEALAQGNVKVEQTEKKVLNYSVSDTGKDIEVSGVVVDEKDIPLPGANVVIKNSNIGISTDIDGRFVIKAKENDILVFSYIGMETKESIVNSNVKVVMKIDLVEVSLGMMIVSKKRTFFGRIFHSIGNWFR